MKAINVITLISICSPLMAMEHDMIKCHEGRKSYTFTTLEDYPEDVVELESKRPNYRDNHLFLIKYKVNKGVTTYVETKDEELTHRIMALSADKKSEVLKELMIKNNAVFNYSTIQEGAPDFSKSTTYNGSVIVRGDAREWGSTGSIGRCRKVFRSGDLYSNQVSTEENRISYRGANLKKVTYKGFEGFQDEFGIIWGDLVRREGEPMALPFNLAQKYCNQIGARLPDHQQMINLFIQLGDDKVKTFSRFSELKGKNIKRRTSDDSQEVLPGIEEERDLNLPILMENMVYDWSQGFSPSKVWDESLGHFRCVKRVNDYLRY